MLKKLDFFSSQKNVRVSKKSNWQFILFRVLSFFLFLSLVYVVYCGWLFLYRPTVLPFKELYISSSANYASTQTIKSVIKKNISGGFFSIDEGKIRVALKRNPWIKAVAIRKVFPDVLRVQVEEYKPVAYWRQWILTASGKLLPVNPKPRLMIPDFSGPDDSVQDVLAEYVTLSQLLVPLRLTIVQLFLSQRRSWVLKLSNGVEVVLGRGDGVGRFKRFVDCYQKLRESRQGDMLRVDLRYPNGIAIKWGVASMAT